MEAVTNDFVKQLEKRPELSSVFSFYSASFPQYLLSVDNDIAQQKGVSIENAMNTLSTLIGSNYEISFIKFGRQYKVIVQAAAQYRALPEDVLKLYVKNEKDEMVPFSAFMKMEKVYGLSEITRHNMYNTAEISGATGHGYSSGEAIKAINEVAKTALPRGYGIDGRVFPQTRWRRAIRPSTSSSSASASSISFSQRSMKASSCRWPLSCRYRWAYSGRSCC